MFKEKYLIFEKFEQKKSTVREHESGIPFEHKKKADRKAELKEEADSFEEGLEKDEKYERAAQLVRLLGYEEKDISSILDDKTNPYLDEIWKFAEEMENGKIFGLRRESTEYDVFLKFKLKDEKIQAGFLINRKLQAALRWKKLIYPQLLEIAGKYKKELDQALKEGGTPLTQEIAYTLAVSDILDYGQDKRLKAELRDLHKGKTVDELWKKAEEEGQPSTMDLLREIIEEYPVPLSESPMQDETPEEAAEDLERMQTLEEVNEIQSKNPEWKKYLDITRESPDPVNLEDLPDFQEKLLDITSQFAQQDEELAPLNEQLSDTIIDIEQLIAEGTDMGVIMEHIGPIREELMVLWGSIEDEPGNLVNPRSFGQIGISLIESTLKAYGYPTSRNYIASMVP